MRIKLDENIGVRGQRVLARAGWDVETVAGEELCGASDTVLIEVCRAEHRALVTLDKDFASVLRFPPARYSGIIVLRLPEPLSREAIEDALARWVAIAPERDMAGRLWIVDRRRIREYGA